MGWMIWVLVNRKVTGVMIVGMKNIRGESMEEIELKITISADEMVELTDQGEYGKMSPRPAVEYWKGRAEKYKANAQKYGRALNKERDRNAELRGKIIQIEKILRGRV